MEQFTQAHFTADSGGPGAGTVGFDVLRALINARQSASPTVRALAGLVSAAAPGEAGTPALIELFARGTASHARIAAFQSGEAVIRQDERHA